MKLLKQSQVLGRHVAGAMGALERLSIKVKKPEHARCAMGNLLIVERNPGVPCGVKGPSKWKGTRFSLTFLKRNKNPA